MYFNSEVQRDILRRFHFALREHGFLFLGKAETLLAYDDLYEPIDLRHRVFVKMPADLAPATYGIRGPASLPNGQEDNPNAEVVAAAFSATPLAHVVVSDGGFLVAANDAARSLFTIRPADLGRPFHDLEMSYRPAELRSLIATALTEGEVQQLRAVRWERQDSVVWLDLDVVPLRDHAAHRVGVSVSFTDVSQQRQLEDELQHTTNALETAYEELQSTNEELETTNEELQSTIEELETTNEELQSSNAELETMNEELQSTNAQLETMNQRLYTRGVELDEANAYLRSILGSLGSAAVVVDKDLVVRFWNDRATELWGLRPDDVTDSHLLNLEIGLPVEALRQPMLACMSDAEPPEPLRLAARDRIGRPIRCIVTCTPLVGDGGQTRGVILLMDATVQET